MDSSNKNETILDPKYTFKELTEYLDKMSENKRKQREINQSNYEIKFYNNLHKKRKKKGKRK